MYMVSKLLQRPSLHKDQTCAALWRLKILEAAVKAIADKLRAGQYIQIIKVIGIKDNEEADKLAHDTMEGLALLSSKPPIG